MNRDDMNNINTLMSQMYAPSVPDRKLKARFWTTWGDGPSKGDPTIEDVERVVGKSQKFADPKFCSWILNTKEMMEDLHFAQSLVMDLLVDGLQSDQLRFGDKLKAASMVWEMTKFTAPKQEIKMLDEEISKLTEEQLEAKIKQLSR